MKAEQIKKFLAALGRHQTTKRGPWVQAPCPFGPWYHKGGKDSNPSFAIKVNTTGRSHFNCFSCARGGSLDDLWVELLHLTKLKGNPENLDLATASKVMEGDSPGVYIPIEEKEFDFKNRFDLMHVWPDWWLTSFAPAWTVERSRQYLEGRGIREAEAHRFHVHYDSLRDAVVFPVYNYRKQLVGARGRYLDPADKRRYHDYDWQTKNSTPYVWYNEDAIAPSQEVVVVTEGIFDAIRVWRHFRQVVSPFSTGVSVSKLKYLNQFCRVIVFGDNDEGGYQLSLKVEKYVRDDSTVVQAVTYPEGTPVGADPGSLKDPQIRLMLKNLKVLLVPDVQ